MAQFGSVFRMKPKPGKKEELLRLFSEEPGRPIKGFVVGHAFDCGDEVYGVAVFEDEASYRANADDPAQHEEYLKMMECLESEPEWHDGTVSTLTQ